MDCPKQGLRPTVAVDDHFWNFRVKPLVNMQSSGQTIRQEELAEEGIFDAVYDTSKKFCSPPPNHGPHRCFQLLIGTITKPSI